MPGASWVFTQTCSDLLHKYRDERINEPKIHAQIKKLLINNKCLALGWKSNLLVSTMILSPCSGLGRTWLLWAYSQTGGKAGCYVSMYIYIYTCMYIICIICNITSNIYIYWMNIFLYVGCNTHTHIYIENVNQEDIICYIRVYIHIYWM
jgi:hypothetical protein